MDVIVTVVIGILGAVFLAAAIGLTVLLFRYKCRKTDLISQQHIENRPEAQLIGETTSRSNAQSPVHVELGAVQISNPRLEEILDNEYLLEDVFGLVPHCLSILKICHHLTDRLVCIGCAYQKHRSPDRLIQMVAVARQISPKVDDVLEAIHPPLDPKLVESRFSSLVLSVSQLAMITKSVCRMSGKVDWIDQSLQNIEDHMRILREAKQVTEERDQGMPPCNALLTGQTQVQTFESSSPVDRNDISQL